MQRYSQRHALNVEYAAIVLVGGPKFPNTVAAADGAAGFRVPVTLAVFALALGCGRARCRFCFKFLSLERGSGVYELSLQLLWHVRQVATGGQQFWRPR